MTDPRAKMIRIRQFTVRDIEAQVSALFARHPVARAVPVPIDLLVELEGVRLDIMRGLEERLGIHGATMRDITTGQVWIFIDDRLADEDRALNRYRSTVSEELGHVVLHRDVIDQVSTEEDFRTLQRHPDWQVVERNAKRFGASTLMPANEVIRSAERIYPELVRVAGFGDPDAILKHLSALLARQFQVSPESMRYRLREWPIHIERRVRDGVDSGLDYLPS
jgi:hypothetical protein